MLPERLDKATYIVGRLGDDYLILEGRIMAQSTLVTPPAKGVKGQAQPIYADQESLDAILAADTNKRLAYNVHPALYVKIVQTIAGDPANMAGVSDGKAEVKRTRFIAWLQKAIATAVGYEGDLALSKRGGNVMSATSAMRTLVAGIFENTRTIATLVGMPEEQAKQAAFESVAKALASHSTLANVEVAPEVLEALWENADVDLGEEEEEEEEEEEPATPTTTVY